MIRPPTPILLPSFASHALQLLHRVEHGLSPIELVYTAHERWPLRPGQGNCADPTLRISVLDASFNPPTLAHLAIINSFPQPELFSQRSHFPSAPVEPCDARILLLSVHNADKVLQPGDATLLQRLDMMRLLSYDVHSIDIAEPADECSRTDANVAIAIIDEPTFVGKSTVLLRFLRTRLASLVEPSDIQDRGALCQWPCPAPKLTFLLGSDTLVRLFSSKYYPSGKAMVQMLRTFLSPDQEAGRILCAYRRSASANTAPEETQHETLKVAQEFISSGRIAFINIGAEEQTYSSSEVRAKVAAGDESWKQRVTGTVAHYVVRNGLYLEPEKRQ